MNSSMEMVTLSKNSPDFERYLLGSHSDVMRALPLDSMNVNSSQEVVTFKLIPKTKINRPRMYFLDLIKPRFMLLLLIPIFSIFIDGTIRKISIDPILSILSALSILVLGVAIGLRNDFSDHMRGIDRLLPKERYRPIQKGWVRAWKIKALSYWLLGFSFVCVLPVFLVHPVTIIYFLVTLLLGAYAQFRTDKSFKDQRFGEVLIFVLLGPILSMGFMSSISGWLFDAKTIGFGLFWGLFSLHLIHIQNFETLLVNSQAGVQNTMTYLGFDRGKNFLYCSWVLIGISYGFFELKWGTQLGCSLWLFLFLLTLPFLYRALRNSSSPLGSYQSWSCKLSYYLIVWVEFFFFMRSLSSLYE